VNDKKRELKTIKNLRDIRRIKPDLQQVDYSDQVEQGLFLRVTSKDVRTWVYRRKINGKSERIKLGHFPRMTIEQARNAAAAQRIAVDQGRNPAQERRDEQERTTNTVSVIANLWIDEHLSQVHWPEARRIMLKDVVPALDKPIADVTKADINAILSTFRERGSPIAANRCLTIMKGFFRWSVEKDYIPASPARDISAPAKQTTRDRVITESELREIFTVTDALEYPLGPFLRMLFLCMTRRGETSAMKWSDIDMERKIWTIPADDTKAGRVHDVYLSTQAVKILDAVPRRKDIDWVWVSDRETTHVNGFGKPKVAIDEAIAANRRKAEIEKDMPHWTFHDSRRFGAHVLAPQCRIEVLSRLLNHAPDSVMGVTAIYNRFAYAEERRTALQALADHIDRIMESR
jgi:integrase